MKQEPHRPKRFLGIGGGGPPVNHKNEEGAGQPPSSFSLVHCGDNLVNCRRRLSPHLHYFSVSVNPLSSFATIENELSLVWNW